MADKEQQYFPYNTDKNSGKSWKEILQTSYKKYNYYIDFIFETAEAFKPSKVSGLERFWNNLQTEYGTASGYDFNNIKRKLKDYINLCCKSIPKIEVNLIDNQVKMMGRTWITPSYISFTSPLSIEFYDINLSDSETPYMLSQFFLDWMEFTRGGGGYLGRKNYTRLEYLDAYAVSAIIGATDEVYNKEINSFRPNKIKRKSDKDIYEGSVYVDNRNIFGDSLTTAYESINAGITTIHGLTNTFIYTTLLASSLVDVISENDSDKGDMIPKKVKEVSAAQSAYDLSRLPVVGGLGTLAGKIAQTNSSIEEYPANPFEEGKANKYVVTNTDQYPYSNDKVKTDFGNRADLNNLESKTETIKKIKDLYNIANLDELQSKQTYSVSLLHYLENTRNFEGSREVIKNLKDLIESTEFVSLSGGKVGYKIPQTVSNEGTNEPAPDIKSYAKDVWNHEVISRFIFDNEEEAKEVKKRLQEILNMLLLGKKPMDIKRLEDDLMTTGNYITKGDLSVNFVKEITDKVKNIIKKSDYYDLDKLTKNPNIPDIKNMGNENFGQIENALNKKDSYTIENGNYFTEIKAIADLIANHNSSIIKEGGQIQKYYGELMSRVMNELDNSEEDLSILNEISVDNMFRQIELNVVNDFVELNENDYKDYTVYLKSKEELESFYKNARGGSSVGKFAGYGNDAFITSRNAMIDATEAFNAAIGIAIMATDIKDNAFNMQISHNPFLLGIMSAIKKVPNAMFVNGGEENYVNTNYKQGESLTDIAKKIPVTNHWGSENKNINGNSKASDEINNFVFNKINERIDEYNKNQKGADEKNRIYNNDMMKPSHSVNYRLTKAYPSKVNITDQFNNEATGTSSMPTFTVQFQFFDAEKDSKPNATRSV